MKASTEFTELREKLTWAALPHVVFDGWSEVSLQSAAADLDIDGAQARLACPRGGVDLALCYHQAGDKALAALMADENLDELRYRDRVALCVRRRLEWTEREAVRKSMALFSLPQYAPLGTQALWQSADQIWTILGDHSEDINWYSKRAILSAVLSSTLLYWLGDESEGQNESWAFLDRRIDGVMQFESAKARFNNSPFGRAFAAGPGAILAGIRKPGMKYQWGRRFPGAAGQRADQ